MTNKFLITIFFCLVCFLVKSQNTKTNDTLNKINLSSKKYKTPSARKIKLIEESGTPLLNVLQKNVAKNDKMPCEDIENCLQCSNDDIGKCRISYITYKLECLEPECHFIYYGETNRNGYSRGREHLQNSQSQTVAGIEKSVISSHAFIHHDGKEIKVKMKILDRFRADPTCRQNAETILIRNSSNDILMN